MSSYVTFAVLLLAVAQTDSGSSGALQVGADQVAAPASAAVGTEQVGGVSARAAAAAGLTAPSDMPRPDHRLSPTGQVGALTRSVAAPQQLTVSGRTALAPPPLSSRAEGRTVSVVVVHGHDRCDPIRGEATREECNAILDNRAEEFAKPSTPNLTPEDALLSSPPSTDLTADATAARRLSGPEGADPSVAAAAAAVEGSPEGAQAAAIGATDRNAPAVPVGTYPTAPAPANERGPTVVVTRPR